MPHSLAFKHFSVFYRYSNCKNLLWKKILVSGISASIFLWVWFRKKTFIYLLFLNNALLPTKDCLAKLNLSTNFKFSVICKRPFCNHDDVVTRKILVPLDPITKKPIEYEI